MNSTCNPAQVRAFHATCSRLGISEEEKRELISRASNDRTDSSRALTHSEMESILTGLNGPQKPQTQVQVREQAIRKMYFYCHQMGWQLKDEKGVLVLQNGRPKVDVARLNAWCIKYGQHHKALDQHSAKEVSDVLTAFQKVYEHHLKNH